MKIGWGERRKGKESLVTGVGIRMEFITKIKNLSISSVETRVPGEKPLQARLREDYFGQSASVG
jgi:hypothetical protein